MIEIISLSDKGNALSHSVRRSNDIGWNAIYFISKNGGRCTRDRLCTFCYGGDIATTNNVIRNLKAKGIVVGE